LSLPLRALLLPIKDLRNAKQRLAAFLTPQQRFELAQAMLVDTFDAVRQVRLAERILVVTNYEPARKLAVENGWEVLHEERQVSESASIDAASQWCTEQGIGIAMRLPLDIPLVRASDIDELLSIECAAPAMIIVPSRDGTGTNAILRSPPALFPSHFGPGSFVKHCEEAQRVGAQIIVRRNAHLEMDVDDESDLQALTTCDLTGTQTGMWLRRTGILTRFQKPPCGKEIVANAG
jgi:2-phospho-L-lactate guanylyltransferase